MSKLKDGDRMKYVATLMVRYHKTKFLNLVLMISSLRYLSVLNQCKISYIIYEYMSVISLIKNQNFLSRNFLSTFGGLYIFQLSSHCNCIHFNRLRIKN